MQNEPQYYPLTHAQKRIWYAEKKYEGYNFGNVLYKYQFIDTVDFDRFIDAILNVIFKYDGLRIRLHENNDGIQQYIQDYSQPELKTHVFSDSSEMEAFFNEFSKIPFQLTNSNLYYFGLYQCQDTAGFYMKLHHIICDAWTGQLLVQAIWNEYLNVGDQENTASYLEYVENEQKYLLADVCKKNKVYWLNKFSNLPEPCHFRMDHLNGSIQSRRIEYYLSREQTSMLHAFCIEYKVTPYTFVFSAFLLVLSRLKMKQDLLLGTLIHNRSSQAEKSMVGMFVNTVPFQISFKGLTTFFEVIDAVSDELKSNIRHQKYPFDLLLQDLHETYGYPTDWLQVVFSYDTFTHCLPNKWLPNDSEIIPLILHVTERESKDRLKFEFDFQTDVFHKNEIDRVFYFIQNILQGVFTTPDIQLSNLSMINADEKRDLLEKFRSNTQSFLHFQPVHCMVEKIANDHPDHIAIADGSIQISYRELCIRSNQLAACLIQHHIGPGSLVGCLFDRSVDLIVTMIGIMKTGASYVPIDPSYPSARIEHIVQDSQMKYLIVDPGYCDKVSYNIEMILYNEELFSLTDIEDYSYPSEADDLLYVIYTSGSTGAPKGVMVEQKGFFNLLQVYRETFQTSSVDRISQVASPGFDAMAFEVWPCLTSGATLMIVPDEIKTDPSVLQTWLHKNEITLSYQPTAIAEFLIHENWGEDIQLRCLMTAGERLKQYPKSRLPFRFFNLYGPTEDTVWTTIFEIYADSFNQNLPPIGYPIKNHKIYILDHELNLQPVGITGELCISGIGLSRGYIHHPELTSQKFIVNPFEPDTRLYRTGDLAFWGDDGMIHYVGRKDNQVQIRGFRVELGEIEQQLMRITGIREAFVFVRGDSSEQPKICACIASNEILTVNKIKNKLDKILPNYMIPNDFFLFNQLPRTAHGKVDIRALPVLSPDKDEREIVAPSTHLEKSLVCVFENILSISPVSTQDHYFEIGGDSIKAIQITYEMHKLGYEMHVADLYAYPTIAQLSNYIRPLKHYEIRNTDDQISPLTPIQCWFFEQQFKDQHIWNQTLMLRTERRLQPETIQLAAMALIQHHQELQFHYHQQNGTWIQQRSAGTQKQFDYFFEDMRHSDVYIDHMQVHIHELQTSMNLEEGPLVKLGHFRTTDGDFLVFIVHHLVIDGVSWRIFIEDFIQGYEYELKGENSPNHPETVSYATWGHHLIEYAISTELMQELPYWQSIGLIKTDLLRKERTIQRRYTRDFRTKKLTLSRQDTLQLIHQAHQAFRTNVQDILLAGLTLSLNQWQEMNQILLHLESHGRYLAFSDISVSRTIGWFTSMYPVILDVMEGTTLPDHIKSTKESLRRVPNQGVGYGILKYLTPPDMKKAETLNIQPDICFNYLGELDAFLKNNSLDLSVASFELVTSPKSEKLHALEMNALVWNDRLEVWCGYHGQEFHEAAIYEFLEIYQKNLKKLIHCCVNQSETECTPSDFGDSSLSLTDLETINNLIDCIE